MRRRSNRKTHRKRKRICFFCTNKISPNYKSVAVLKRLTTERGKIVPRRMTGTCAKHQRKLATAIKRARQIAVLPFVTENIS